MLHRLSSPLKSSAHTLKINVELNRLLTSDKRALGIGSHERVKAHNEHEGQSQCDAVAYTYE